MVLGLMKKHFKVILLGFLIILIAVPVYIYRFSDRPNLISYSVGYQYGQEINAKIKLNKYKLNQKDFAKGFYDAINNKTVLYPKNKMFKANEIYLEYQPGGEKYPVEEWMGSGA